MMSASWGYLLMYVPLLIAVSFVIGGTRHEKKELIIDQTVRTAVWITSFMFFIFVVLFFVSWIV